MYSKIPAGFLKCASPAVMHRCAKAFLAIKEHGCAKTVFG